MQFPESKGIRAGQWFPNEIFRDDDINFLNEKEYTNITAALAAIAEQGILSGADVVIAGLLLEWDNLLTSNLRAGMAVSPSGYYVQGGSWGFGASAGDIFSVTVPVDTSIAVLTGGSQPRIDVLEVRPIRTEYDSKSRNFKDPVTGLVTAANIDTKIEYGFGFQVLQGTEGASPSAPTHTAGWIKLAEIYVAASATAIDQDDIKDVRDSDTWTTEANDTIYKTVTQANKVPILDAGSRYTASETESALQEIAGSGRTSETVKGNADNIGISIKRISQIIDGGVSVKDCVYYDTGDSKWKVAGKWKVPPQGLYLGSNTVLLVGYISGLTGLTAGKVYWMLADGTLTSDINLSYKATRIAYALSTTELILGIWLERGFSSENTMWGFFGGGDTGANSNVIDYIDTTVIATVNAIDRGDLTVARYSLGGVSDPRYGFYGGGTTGTYSNIIDLVNMDLLFSNAVDRGDITVARSSLVGVSGPQYGFYGGGVSGSNVIETISLLLTLGNAIDRGNLSIGRSELAGVAGSQYGHFGGGEGAGAENEIDYIDLSLTVGNAIDRGNLSVARKGLTGVSGPQYGFYAGGWWATVWHNVIDSIDMAVTSAVDAIDRGDLTQGRAYLSGLSGPKYGHFGGGSNAGGTYRNEIDYIDITIITVVNAFDRGDLSVGRRYMGGIS